MTTSIERVRAAWLAYNTPLEGVVHTLYSDVRGLPTVAVGALVSSVAVAQTMRWLRPDGHPASPEEIAAEWQRVKAMPKGLPWRRYKMPGALRLDVAEVERVTLVRFDANLEVLTRTFPALPAWPWQAAAGALSMAWALGAGFPLTWPRWTAAAQAGAWRACGADCEIRWRDNPGVRPRNLAQQALFLLAEGVSSAEARAAWPAGPSASTAARALTAFGI